MNQTTLSQLSNQELLEKKNKAKTSKIMDALIIGFMVGVAVYSTVKNGWGLLTFLPLLYLPVGAKNKKDHAALEAEIRARNL